MAQLQGKQSFPTLTLTVLAGGAITAQRFVKADGTQAGAGDNTIGVARTDAAPGERFPVDAEGTVAVESGAAVTAGDTVKSDSSGRAITWASSGAKVGIAQQASSGAGVFIEVLLIPNAA